MESIAKIRRMYYVEGKGIRTIARALNISKNTVKKVIRSDKTKFELTQHSRKKPALENYLGILHQLLEKNSEEPLRRRMTSRKLYQQLQASGYRGSYESVNLITRKFRREREAKGKQVFIPLDFEPGEAFQFDWGEEEINLNEKTIKSTLETKSHGGASSFSLFQYCGGSGGSSKDFLNKIIGK